MQARHNASVKYMAVKNTFTISAFLKVKSETSRMPKQEPALSPSVLPLLTVPCCLELRMWVWKWSPEAVSVWDWVEVLRSTSFLGQPLFVLQVSQGDQPALLTHKAGTTHPKFSLHALWGIRSGRKRWAEPGPPDACRVTSCEQRVWCKMRICL